MKKINKKFCLLEDIKMLQVNFIMIYIIHEMSISLKIIPIIFNYLIFETLFQGV